MGMLRCFVGAFLSRGKNSERKPANAIGKTSCLLTKHAQLVIQYSRFKKPHQIDSAAFLRYHKHGRFPNQPA